MILPLQGTARRKKKIVHKTATDDKKLQNTFKRLGINSIQSIEEVNMIKDDGHVLHFTNPKGYPSPPSSPLRLLVNTISCNASHSHMHTHAVQASLSANTFAISGNCEDKRKPLLRPLQLS